MCTPTFLLTCKIRLIMTTLLWSEVEMKTDYDHHSHQWCIIIDDANQEFWSSLYLFCYSVLPSWIIGFKVMLAAKNTFFLFQWRQRQVIFATTHNYYFEPISSYFWNVHSKNCFPNWLEICVRQVVRAAGKAHPLTMESQEKPVRSSGQRRPWGG